MKKKICIDNMDDLSQYLYELKGYYGWSEQEWNPVEKKLQSLTQRRNDKNLYLGVVGEFSSGKSTLINALLGIDLLKEDILPGTTCAPTLLCYGDKFDVEIYSKRSKKVLSYSKSFGELKDTWNLLKAKTRIKKDELKKQITQAKDFIDKYTADEDFAKNVTKVIIYLPCKLPIFENNVVIVDTPGINADNPRHQDVTEKAVKELCDLAIVLTPAPSPCSQTLITFVNDYLKRFQKHCICLASQMDRVRKAERKRQLKYIEERFRSEGINFSAVYPVAAYYALHVDDKKTDAEEFRDGFASTVQTICDSLKNNKELILLDRMKMLLQHIISSMLNPMLENTKRDFEERIDQLQKNQLIAFDKFLRDEKKILLKKIQCENVSQSEIYDIVGEAKENFTVKLLPESVKKSRKRRM